MWCVHTSRVLHEYHSKKWNRTEGLKVRVRVPSLPKVELEESSDKTLEKWNILCGTCCLFKLSKRERTQDLS